MARPARIASLLSSATEILFAIGAGDRVAAVSHECDFPAAASERPKATGSRVDSQQSSDAIDEQVRVLMQSGEPLYEIDRDLLRRLAPGLIVTQAQCDVCAVRYQDVVEFVRSEASLQGAGIVALNPQSLDDILADILRVGDAAECSDQARRYVAALQGRIDAVRNKTASLPLGRRPSVVCIEWIDPLMPAGNWTPQLIELAGGMSGLAIAGEHSRYATWSELAEFDPEIIIIAPCGFDLRRALHEAEVLRNHSQWSRLSAIRAGRVYALDGNAYLNRSGPRIVDSLEILAHLLHPDLFPPPHATHNGEPAWKLFC